MRSKFSKSNQFPTGRRVRLDAELLLSMEGYLQHHAKSVKDMQKCCSADRAQSVGINRDSMRAYARLFTNIYFILCTGTGAIKIGRSDNVNARLLGIQSSSASEVRLIGSFRAHYTFENFLHSSFSAHNVRGEWFKAADDLLDVVEVALVDGFAGAIGFFQRVIEAKEIVDVLTAKA